MLNRKGREKEKFTEGVFPSGARSSFPLYDEDIEYSFALEYNGPPVTYPIPKVIPMDIDRIPCASLVDVSVSSFNETLPLPVAQPLRFPPPPKSPPTKKQSPTSVIEFSDDAVGGSGPSEIPPVAGIGFSGEFEEKVEISSGRNSMESPMSSGDAGIHVTNPRMVNFEDASATEATSPVLKNSNGQKRQSPNRAIKKGSCHLCGRGNRFTEKEACLACDAKYCANCVIAAMGSMPEGRKCVACIGRPVMESKRELLGKCSKMHKRLLSLVEIQQLMRSEKCCETNQHRPEQVFVNWRPLSTEEMVLLQTCQTPPSKLKPGHYWYDKVSGLWGKEGHKPEKIISPYLHIGGALMSNASNGNTGIFINGREITKPERTLLQFAGAQCAGNPNFWVNADGTYQEEGQKNIKGNIWGKTGTKLVCSILSLPLPSKLVKRSEEEAEGMSSRGMPDYIEQRSLQKLLLIGNHGSGASTIFKQVSFLYKPNPFSEEERENYKLLIQRNIYHFLGILLENRERFEEECLSGSKNDELDHQTPYSISPRLREFSKWLIQVMESGGLEAIFPAATREYAPLVEQLWNSPAIKATCSRRSELSSLPRSAGYLLERVVDITKPEYEPSDMDILHCDGIPSSSGLAYMEFSFAHKMHSGTDVDPSHQHGMSPRYQLIRIQTKGEGENYKWLEMFEDVRIVIFTVALTDYNEYCVDASGMRVNKMLVNKNLFESIVTHPAFKGITFLLILSKFDILEQTIEQVPLTICDWFSDFNPVTSRRRPNSNNIGTSPAQHAFHYIAVKFKKLFASLTGRNLYATMANGLDSDSVDEVFRYTRDILNWEEERVAFESDDDTIYSSEPSS